jgi:hypothetical protein
MAKVERNWFRRVLVGDNAGPIYDPHADERRLDQTNFFVGGYVTLRWIYTHMIGHTPVTTAMPT